MKTKEEAFVCYIQDVKISIPSDYYAFVEDQKIEAKNRYDLLIAIGDYLKEHYGFGFPQIMGFYNVVPIKSERSK